MKSILSLFLVSFSLTMFAQLNTSLTGQLQYNQQLNDVWGYVAPDGTEYALVGLIDGVSIVSLTDPANPTEVAFLPGLNSTWRDLKTFGEYAYVTTEAQQGLQVIDLTDLPNSAPFFNWKPSTGGGIGGTTLGSCHNIYIDDLGVAYLAGCNLNNGGMLFVDVATTPGSPELIAMGDPRYSHDVYVRDNIMYSSDINDGFFSITDVSDKQNTNLLATRPTPFNFTHNTWLSDDSQTIFTTDETGNAPVAAYDISDLDNIELLDEFRPLATINQGVIPHNVHVLNDFLVISFYTDGLVIVDASDPSNMIEVGNYDTFTGPGAGFGGAWGAYPFLPSGLILVSDQSSGLFVVEPDYQRAAYLEGNVLDVDTNNPIADAKVNILTTSTFEQSKMDGTFKTGLATAGTYEVEVSKPGYEPTTVSVTLENGATATLDVALKALPSFAFTGQVTEAVTGEIIADAQVSIVSEDFSFETQTNAEGNFTIETFYAGDYEIFAGRWGYKTASLATQAFSETNNSTSIALEKGIEDVFALDLGWQTTFAAFSGAWELATPPIGVFVDQIGGFITPPMDVEADLGNGCYVTGNIAETFDGVFIGGDATLTSPSFDLTAYNQPILSYQSWYLSVNANTGTPTTIPMTVKLSNGNTSIELEKISFDPLTPLDWRAFEIDLTDKIELTANMTISFELSSPGFNNAIEAGVDYFQVVDANPTSSQDIKLVDYQVQVMPNPSQQEFQLQYDLPQDTQQAQLQIFNQLGQLIETIALNQQGYAIFGNNYSAGVYLAQIITAKQSGKAIKLIKQ